MKYFQDRSLLLCLSIVLLTGVLIKAYLKVKRGMTFILNSNDDSFVDE
jgi:hypothetical protein